MVNYKSIFILSMPLIFCAAVYMLFGFNLDNLVTSFRSLEFLIFMTVCFLIIYHFELLLRNFLYAFVPTFLFGISYVFLGFVGFLGCAVFIAIVLSVLRSMNKLPKVNNERID
jgi:hypothetical protein